MKKTIGIFAYVDAGKTTFSEQLLYYTKSIRNLGKVDNKNTCLDNNEIEKKRGITIFADQANFLYNNNEYYLIDTPGHIDFSAEMERTIAILDIAIILISAVEGIQSHTETIFELLKKYNVPVVFFINKIDRIGANVDEVFLNIKAKFDKNIYNFSKYFKDNVMSEELIELIAENNEKLMQIYFDNGYDEKLWLDDLKLNIKLRKIFPYFVGSALNGNGISEFLESFDLITNFDEVKECNEKFSARIYKIRYDNQGNRQVFLKIMSGKLKVKDEIKYIFKDEEKIEKINQIRIYNGSKFKVVNEVSEGDICAVIGLTNVNVGDFLGDGLEKIDKIKYEITPTLMAKVIYDKNLSDKELLNKFKILEDEEPILHVLWDNELKEIHIHTMGVIQLEVLKELVLNRFSINIEFGDCEILYKETIKNSVIGYGHFEPLRHYAEVHLMISEGKRGSGIVFKNKCNRENLDINYQNLIKTHIFEKEHKGVLIGATLTDVEITLLTGRAHLKHTEGGDFREATYRAIRQGLEKAQNIVLEPFYSFKIEVPLNDCGRVMSDIGKMYGTFETPETLGEKVRICGEAPVSEFMNYSKEVLSFTKGKGSISLKFAGYRECHNQKEVIEKINYDKGADKENTSASIFCAKGAGFLVTWDKVEDYIHCETVKN